MITEQLLLFAKQCIQHRSPVRRRRPDRRAVASPGRFRVTLRIYLPQSAAPADTPPRARATDKLQTTNELQPEVEINNLLFVITDSLRYSERRGQFVSSASLTLVALLRVEFVEKNYMPVCCGYIITDGNRTF